MLHTLLMLPQNSAVFSNLNITVFQQILDSSIQIKMTANCNVLTALLHLKKNCSRNLNQ